MEINGNTVIQKHDRVLITGAGGFLGPAVVDVLLRNGFGKLRCLVRSSSRRSALDAVLGRHAANAREGVEMVTGDLLSREDCRAVAGGVAGIYHLAAGVEKSFAGAFMNSALATRNLVEAALVTGELKRFVNVSSFAVYSNLAMSRGSLLDESCPLETAFQDRWDAYGFGKAKQDEIVIEYGQTRQLPYVILRPGAIFGPGKRALSGRVGIDTFGTFLHMGGPNLIPLTYVENCAEAIVLAGLVPGIEKEVFNVVDDDLLTSRQLLRAFKKAVGGFRSVRVPFWAASAMSSLWEKYSRWSKGQLPPVFNRRRCSAEWKGNRYSNQKLKDRLGWKPGVPMAQALQRFLSQFEVPARR